MPDTDALVAPFRDGARYHRTGILLVHQIPSPAVERLATLLPADRIDWARRVVSGLSEARKWIDQSPEIVLAELRELGHGPAPFVGRVIEGLDLVSARWEQGDAFRFWNQFMTLERQLPHALVAVLPEAALFMGPHPHDLAQMEREGRVVRMI